MRELIKAVNIRPVTAEEILFICPQTGLYAAELIVDRKKGSESIILECDKCGGHNDVWVRHIQKQETVKLYE